MPRPQATARGCLVLLVTLALCGPAALPVAAAGPRPTGPLVPPDGALLGAYVDPDGRWSGVEAAKQDVRSLEQRLGRTLAIDHHFYAWTDAFPGPLERWDVEQGRIPLVTWEPWGTDLQSIASGAHDALIRQRAREVAAFGADVMLRLAHEMNGDWYPWSGDRNGGGTTGPQRYVAAWRRVHDLFEAEGATNAVWVWAPNHVDVPQEPWNQWTSYYPGDAHVDWVGIDAYNWGRSQPWSSWTALADLIAPLYGDYAARKPLMVSETSSTEVGGDKAAWIAQARSDLKQRFPSVAGLVWFHVDKEQDWRIDSSTAAFSAFRDLAHDPYFSGSSGGVKVLGGRAAVSDAVVAEVGRVSGVQPQRLSGPDRYATAAAVVADAFPGRVPVVYVATGEAFADALAGSAAAAVVDGPVLLVGHDHVPSATARQLGRLQPSAVKVLGGRDATAAAVVADAFPGRVPVVYVATGEAFADALAGSAAAAVVDGPVLLVGHDHVPSATARQLDRSTG